MAPDVVSAKAPDLMMLRTDVAAGMGQSCDTGSIPQEAPGFVCRGVCQIPCMSGGVAVIFSQASNSVGIVMAVRSSVEMSEPLLLDGVLPSVEPLPPKLPV